MTASPADWVAAVGTAAATLIAAGALAVQAWDRRRAIPIHVNGWVRIDEGLITSIVLSNASPVPVYDVVARVIYQGETLAVTGPDSLPPGDPTPHDLSEPVQLWAGAADLLATIQGPKVALVFRDPAGRVWRKRSRGTLKRQRRRYDWAEEYRHALGETPSLQVESWPTGSGEPPTEPRLKPRD